eukprot:5337875-Prymnesium_polylepis.1
MIGAALRERRTRRRSVPREVEVARAHRGATAYLDAVRTWPAHPSAQLFRRLGVQLVYRWAHNHAAVGQRQRSPILRGHPVYGTDAIGAHGRRCTEHNHPS